MNISAASDYGIRAALFLASAYRKDQAQLSTTEQIATAEKIPLKFLEAIIRILKEKNLVESRRGLKGGHRLTKSPSEISVAEIIRAIDGPLASVKGERPETIKYSKNANNLKEVWVAVRSNLRGVLENVYLEQIITGDLPNFINKANSQPGAWNRR